MDCPGVRCASEHTIERVNLAHQVAFAQTTDCRVAAHCADSIEVKAHQRRARTHARRRAGSLHPGVTAADDKNVEGLHRAQIGRGARIVKDDSSANRIDHNVSRETLRAEWP